MKRIVLTILTAIITATLIFASACSRSEFGVADGNTEKTMIVQAMNADQGDYFVTGTLEVGEKEQIVVSAELEKGTITFEFISNAGMDDIEEVPDIENLEAAYSTEVSGQDSVNVEIDPGSYLVRATVAEKASGAVQIEVLKAPVAPSDEKVVAVDIGKSEIYSEEDRHAAIDKINEEFASWKGCTMKGIRYAGDDCVTEDNLKRLNELEVDKNYTECIEFLIDFHSPARTTDLEGTSWEADSDYLDYEWWLARTDGGEWEIVTYGY